MLKLDRLYKSESVLEILQEAILSGDIEAGTEITQTDAALSLGVSRMPVRDALISLEYCGLLERLPGQHVRVVSLDEEIINNIFHDMAMLATEIIKDLDAWKLRELSLIDNQIRFHCRLREMTRSPMRKKFLEIFSEIYLPFVLKYSERKNIIDATFKKFIDVIANLNEAKLIYYSYSATLASELVAIRIKKHKNKN